MELIKRDIIVIPESIKNYKYPIAINPNCFYDNFKNKIVGNANGQGYIVKDGTGNIVGTSLEVVSDFGTNIGTLIDTEFTEGMVRFLVNKSTNPKFFFHFGFDIVTRKSMAIYSTGANVTLAIEKPTNTALVNFTAPSEDYYVELIMPTMFTGSIIEVRVWGISGSRPGTASIAYTLTAGEETLPSKYIGFQSIGADVCKISEIIICKGLNFKNKPYSEAYFNGRWMTQVLSGVEVVSAISGCAEFYSEIDNTTSIIANFVNNTTGSPYISWSIDGGGWNKVALTSTISLGTVTKGKHIVRFIVEQLPAGSDPVWSKILGVGFAGFTLGSEGTAIPYIPNKKRILFLGDSITAGIGGNYNGASYTKTCADLLGAIAWEAGYSGTGVIQTGNGGFPVASTYLNYASADKKITVNENPSAIVVALGTNDAQNSGFITAYASLIDAIKAKYPGIIIFCVRPINRTDGGTSPAYHAPAIESTALAKGCNYVDTSTWVIPLSDTVHPNTAGHLYYGQLLSDAIKKAIGDNYFI